jgi:hypothetical protein
VVAVIALVALGLAALAVLAVVVSLIDSARAGEWRAIARDRRADWEQRRRADGPALPEAQRGT